MTEREDIDYSEHTVHNEPIPRNRLRQFHEILCRTGGRYLSTPRDCGDVFRVDYAPGDYQLQAQLWQQCTTPIREVHRNQWWRVMWRRLVNLKVRF